MPTTPLSLVPVGGAPYGVIRGHLIMLYTGAWVLDCELSATDVQILGLPSGRCVVTFGGVPMSGTIDPSSSGTFGPTAMVRVVAGGNGWATSPTAQSLHADNGVLSTQVYEAVASDVGEVLVDIIPTVLGVDVIVDGNDPASSVFRDAPWFVDTTGTTYVGPRPPSIPDLSLVIRDWDPVHQKATFSCDTLLLPNTPLVDPRFNGSTFTVYNVEQVFDAGGSIGWAWANATPSTLVIDELKAAVLHWTRASLLRTYRYRLVVYQGDGPSGGPTRMALQAVTPSAGVPDLLNIAPWSGVPGVVAELAGAQEVLVGFENADPTLPRVLAYSLVQSGGPPTAVTALPLTLTADAATTIAIGPSAVQVAIAGGGDFLVLATPYEALLASLSTFASTLSALAPNPPTTLPQALADIGAIITAATTLSSALSALPPPATVKTKAT